MTNRGSPPGGSPPLVPARVPQRWLLGVGPSPPPLAPGLRFHGPPLWLLRDQPPALWGGSRIFLLLHRAGSMQQVAGALTAFSPSLHQASHGSWALKAVSPFLPVASPRLPPLQEKKKIMSLKIPREYFCALRPRSGDGWPCSASVSSTLPRVGEEGCASAGVEGPPPHRRARDPSPANRKAPTRCTLAPSPPLFLMSGVFSIPTRFRFRFLGLLFAVSPTHPLA